MQLQNIKIKQCISSIFHKNDSDTKKELEAYILILVNPSISSMAAPLFFLVLTSVSWVSLKTLWGQMMDGLNNIVSYEPCSAISRCPMHVDYFPTEWHCVWVSVCIRIKGPCAHACLVQTSTLSVFISFFPPYFVDKVSYWTVVSNYLDCPAIELQEYACLPHPQCWGDIYSHTPLCMSTWHPPHSVPMLAQRVLEPALFPQGWKQQNEFCLFLIFHNLSSCLSQMWCNNTQSWPKSTFNRSFLKGILSV